MRTRLGVLASLVVVMAAAAPAVAAPLEWEHYEWSESGEACGYDRESSGHGLFMIRAATPSTGGQFFDFQDKYWWQDVITNPANGKWAVASGNGLFKEVRAVPQGDDVFTYHTIEAGQPFRIADMRGRVVLRDRGLIDIAYTFDTLGDSAPGGVYYGEWLVRVSAPHPAFEDTFDFCAVIDDLIG
jgi:hypothetical protein